MLSNNKSTLAKKSSNVGMFKDEIKRDPELTVNLVCLNLIRGQDGLMTSPDQIHSVKKSRDAKEDCKKATHRAPVTFFIDHNRAEADAVVDCVCLVRLQTSQTAV